MKIQHSVRLCESCHWLYFKTVNLIHIRRWWWCARWDWRRQTVSEWQPMPCLQSQQSCSLQSFYSQKCNKNQHCACSFICGIMRCCWKKNCQWSVLKFLNALWCYFGFTMTTILIFFPISFVNMRKKMTKSQYQENINQTLLNPGTSTYSPQITVANNSVHFSALQRQEMC